MAVARTYLTAGRPQRLGPDLEAAWQSLFEYVTEANQWRTWLSDVMCLCPVTLSAL
jgi:hypothetical protein